jgi:hypothetical protein
VEIMTIVAHKDKNSKYKNAVGTYYVSNPSKTGGITSYQFKSKLEMAMMKYCDENEKILQWSYEPDRPLSYIDFSSIDEKTNKPGKQRKYYIDFVVVYKTREGKQQIVYIEVKAHRETQPPPKNSNPKEMKTWIRNSSKWSAAKKFCESKGYLFRIVTEREFGVDYY